MTPPNESARIADQLERAYQGDAWHGSNVVSVLEDVTADESVARPLAAAHTIREIVDHMSVWLNAVATRLEGEPWSPATDAEDWPPTTESNAAAWQVARKNLEQAEARLRQIIEAYPPDRLDKPPVKGANPAYVQAHGAVQHTLYHLGQVALLKKVLRG